MFGLLLGTKTVGADGKRRLTASQVHSARQYLADILRSYMLVSVLVLSLGPAVVPRLLPSLLGPRWSSPGLTQLLASYCYYVPIMAFNGILEAFVSSTATPRELRAQSMWMAFCSIDLIGAAYVFLVWGKFGASGIVWANVTSMFLRIVWAYRFMTKYFSKRKDGLSIRDFLPSRRTLTSGVLASAVMSSMAKDAVIDATGLTKLIGVGVAFAIMILSLEAKFLFELYAKWYQRSGHISRTPFRTQQVKLRRSIPRILNINTQPQLTKMLACLWRHRMQRLPSADNQEV
ncbi:Oligosaccharide translocation protein rft1 [Ascosphaera atra]|nr:Oligosaccharide translocation protein rft1 [Ascosphaera atra]